MFVDLTARALINAGSIRAIGVASPQASSLMPSVPPISAAPGLGTFEMASWHGIHGPANMAPALVDKLHAAFNKALTSPSVIEKFKEVGAEPVSMTLPEYTEFFRQQQQQWKDRISEAGIEPQ
jgi:tripartite-type tricarboxylate transporter receptor subunit TctC